MNIDELKKVWDDENNQPLYVINQINMEKIIEKKGRKANRRVVIVENFMIGMNILIPIGLIIFAAIQGKDKASIYFMEAFMFLTAAYIMYHRQRRLSSQKNWGKSIMNSLDEAIHNATYQARLTKTLLVWYLLGLGVISVVMLILEGKPLWLILLMIGFFIGASLLGRLEQKYLHDRYRDELIAMKSKLSE